MTDCLTGLSERVCVWLSVQTRRSGKERERRKLRGEETPAKKNCKAKKMRKLGMGKLCVKQVFAE